MKRRFRLTRTSDFQRVRQHGRSYAHPLMILIALPNPDGGIRVGVAAGKSVGNAVRRNRAKRMLRSMMQPVLSDLQVGWDLVLIARRPLIETPYAQGQAALATLIQRAKLISGSE